MRMQLQLSRRQFCRQPRTSVMRAFLAALVGILGVGLLCMGATARADVTDIYCTIREPIGRLNCLWIEKDVQRKMTSGDISNFIDQAQVSAYMTVKSRAGHERVFLVDPEASSFKRLNEVKKHASISDINKAKSDLFTEIESKVVKLSDDLDLAANAAELVKYDSSVATDRSKLRERELVTELDKYRANDKTLAKGQPASSMDEGVMSLGDSKHKLTLAYENVGYAGTFTQNSSERFNSVDNMAALLSYRFLSSRWIWEAETEYYTAYSNFNKGATGGSVNYAGTDSSKSINSLFLRGNYCYLMSGYRLCPGLELGYDQFPVMSFKTLNVTGTNPNGTSVLEMQSVTDLTVGANVMLTVPLFRSIMLDSRLAYLYGTGALGGTPKSKTNRAMYLSAVADWAVSSSVSLQFGLEYLTRTSSFDVTANNNSNVTVGVDNPQLSQFTSRFGLSWNWGG